MAQNWFDANFPGTCGNPACKKPYEKGFRILVDITDVKDAQGRPVMGDNGKPKRNYRTVKCDACKDDKAGERDARTEQDAGLRSNLPKTYQQYLERCGTLRDAIESLAALGDQMRTQLKAHKRTLEDLLIAAIDAAMVSSSLQTCDPASWASALRACCALGVIPDPGMGPAALAWFVPRGNKVSLDQSYRNMANLAFNSPAFKSHAEFLVWECERILGNIVFLLRSGKAHEREAGNKLIAYYQTDPRAMEGLSAWDQDVIRKALDRPDGLVWAWFRYQESPEKLIHQRPEWFKAPEWSRTGPLPWGVYADAALRNGGRGIAVLTREECYTRAVKGGNVRLVTMKDGSVRLGTRYAKPAEGGRESSDSGWDNAAWCWKQDQMLMKTAIRDLMTGGRVPITVRMQTALSAEIAEDAIIDGEFTQVAAPQTLDQHLRTIAGGQRVPDAYQIEDQGEAPDYTAEAERLNQREPVPVGSSVEGLRELMRTAPDAAVMDAYDAAGVPSGVPVEEFNAQQREAFLKALRGGA